LAETSPPQKKAKVRFTSFLADNTDMSSDFVQGVMRARRQGHDLILSVSAEDFRRSNPVHPAPKGAGEVELAAMRAGRFLAPDLLSLSYIPMRLLCLRLSLILLLRVVVHRSVGGNKARTCIQRQTCGCCREVVLGAMILRLLSIHRSETYLPGAWAPPRADEQKIRLFTVA